MPRFDRTIPLLVCEDIPVAHDFLVKAFGFESTASNGLVVHVDDVDAHYEHARAAGATIESEPTDQPYGQRE